MNLTGVFAPIPTPFDRRDRLDTARLRSALAKWLGTRLTGFVVLGTSGESALVDDREGDRVVAVARETIPPNRPLIVGTGRESTRATVRASVRAARLGADAVLVRTPGFFKAQMTQDAFLAHYAAVADASPVPVLLYNFPALTGVALETATVARLAAHPNIIGLKDSSGDVLQLSDFVAAVPTAFSVLSGSGSTFYTAVSMGAAGGILALACVRPDDCSRLFDLARAASHAEARSLQQELLPLAKLVGATYGIPGLKAALQLVGYDVGVPRQPVPAAGEAAVAALREALYLDGG